MASTALTPNGALRVTELAKQPTELTNIGCTSPAPVASANSYESTDKASLLRRGLPPRLSVSPPFQGYK
jgi:hypothetical protein